MKKILQLLLLTGLILIGIYAAYASQTTNWGVPLTGPVTPSVMAQRMDDSLDALLSSHFGTSRPSYAVEGTFWVDDVDATESSVYYYDGADDIYIGKLDLTNNYFYPVSENIALTASGTEINTVADGPTAKNSHTHLLADGATDITTPVATLNALAPSPTFVNNADGSPNISSTYFAVDDYIGASWETVGPTGAGRTNTWTALDSVPTDADYIVVRLFGTAANGAASSNLNMSLDARDYGSSAAVGQDRRIFLMGARTDASGVCYAIQTVKAIIPVSSTVSFSLYYAEFFAVDSMIMYLLGWGFNP